MPIGRRQSNQPNHLGGNFNLAKMPKEIWRTSIGDGANDRRYLLSSPVVQNNIVYTMDARGHVSALQLKDGKQIWRVSVLPKKDNGETPVGGLAVYEDKLYVTNGRRDVMALDTKKRRLDLAV